jgi:ketosteroid isomerase-like protein
MFVLVFSAATFAFGECTDTDKKALEAFDRTWSEAGEKGNRAALMNVYADDYISMPEMTNKTQAIDDTMKSFERDKVNPLMADKISHDNYMITCTPTTATITHRNVITTKAGAGGKEETFFTRSVHFLEKRKGKWQVVSNAGHGLDDYGVLMYMEHDWNNATLKRDVEWFDKNYAADFSGVSSRTGAIMNKVQDVADMKNDKSVFEPFELSEMNIRIDGNTAVVTGVNRVKGRDEKGQPFDFRTRFTDTFIRRDGRWQVWATQGTRIPTETK